MEKKEHEPRKLFIGGLPRAGVTEVSLRAHFARYGNVVDALVMRFPGGLGRGFGFVEFQDEAAVLRALDSGESDSHNAFFGCKVEVKRAEKKPETRSRQTQAPIYISNAAELKKIFVGGLRDHHTTGHIVDYFKKFGEITDAIVMYDKLTKKPRGFGFVTFESQEATNKVLQNRFHYLNGTTVETKNAEPRGSKHSPSNHYGGLYSPYNIGYMLPHQYPYHYIACPYVPHEFYTVNQMGTFAAVIPESDIELSHIKGNQQRVGTPTSIGTKSNPVKPDGSQQRDGIPSSIGTKSDPVKPDPNSLLPLVEANVTAL